MVAGQIPTRLQMETSRQREQGTALSCERLYLIPPEMPEPPLSHLPWAVLQSLSRECPAFLVRHQATQTLSYSCRRLVLEEGS